MSQRLGRFLNQVSDMPQWQMHGPMFQAECHWCGENLDVYDTMAEAQQSTIDHDCQILVTKSELDFLS